MLDSVELPRDFIPSSVQFNLREQIVPFDQHYLFTVGRHLAQLHQANRLMRDLSPSNIMFRRQDGYPVLCDSPRRNTAGREPHIVAGDFFVPSMMFSHSELNALLSGYVQNAQRLLDSEMPNFTSRVLQHIGGTILDTIAPQLSETIFDVAIMLEVDLPLLAVPRKRFGDPLVDDFIFGMFFLNVCGIPAKNLLGSGYYRSNIKSAVALEADGPFLSARDGKNPSEAEYLSGIRQRFEQRGDSFANEFTAVHIQNVIAVLRIMGQSEKHRRWAQRFAKFSIEALTAIGRVRAADAPAESIQAVQMAHVMLQHMPFASAAASDLLQTIRCASAQCPWYWSGDEAETHPHCIALRNSESLTLRKLAFNEEGNGAKSAHLLHCAFEHLENDKNLIGASASMMLNGQSNDGLSDVAMHTLLGAAQRMKATHQELASLLKRSPKVTYSFGWDQSIWTKDKQEGGSGFKDPPQSQKDLVVIDAILGGFTGAQKTADSTTRAFHAVRWAAHCWGINWHTPFDRLGENGFRAVVVPTQQDEAKKSEESSDSDREVVRAGLEMIIFDTFNVEGSFAQLCERLHPVPGKRTSSYHGGEA